jgi:hypothetical protein
MDTPMGIADADNNRDLSRRDVEHEKCLHDEGKEHCMHAMSQLAKTRQIDITHDCIPQTSLGSASGIRRLVGHHYVTPETEEEVWTWWNRQKRKTRKKANNASNKMRKKTYFQCLLVNER